MNKENILYYQSNIKTSRNEDSVYAMKYANQQMLIDKLQQENKQLKIQISAREEVCNRLESNWNMLKEHLKEKIAEGRSPEHLWLMGCYDEDKLILDKMQELEQGSDK